MSCRGNPQTMRKLTPQEVRKLRFVLQEPYLIHNMDTQHVPDVLEIRPAIFLRSVLQQLLERGIEVSDVRINGGAASYVLNPTIGVVSASLSESSSSSLLFGAGSSNKSRSYDPSLLPSGSSTRTNPTPKSNTASTSVRNSSVDGDVGPLKSIQHSSTSEHLFSHNLSSLSPYDYQKRYFNDLDIVVGVKFDVKSQETKFNTIREVVLGKLTDVLAQQPSSPQLVNPGIVSTAYINKMFKKFDEAAPDVLNGDLWSLISLHNRNGRGLELKFVHTMKRQYEFTTDSFQIIISSSFLNDIHARTNASSISAERNSLDTEKMEMKKSTDGIVSQLPILRRVSSSSSSTGSRRREEQYAQTDNNLFGRSNGPVVLSHSPITANLSLQQPPPTSRPSWWSMKSAQSHVPRIPERPQPVPPLASPSPTFEPQSISFSTTARNPAIVAASLSQPFRTRVPPGFRETPSFEAHRRVSICLGEKKRRSVPFVSAFTDAEPVDFSSASIGISPDELLVPPEIQEGISGSSSLPKSAFASYLRDLPGGGTQFIVERRAPSGNSKCGSEDESDSNGHQERGFFFDSDDSQEDSWDSPSVVLPHDAYKMMLKSDSPATLTESNDSDLSDFGGSFVCGVPPHELNLESKESSESADSPLISEASSGDGGSQSDDHNTESKIVFATSENFDLPLSFEKGHLTGEDQLSLMSNSREEKDDFSQRECEESGAENDIDRFELYAFTLYSDFEEAYHDLCHRKITVDKPEEIRGGGLLRYCDLTYNGYELSDKYSAIQKEKLESTMLARFFMDYDEKENERDAIQTYLKSHYISRDWVKKKGFLEKILEIVPKINTNYDETVDCFIQIIRSTLNDIEQENQRPRSMGGMGMSNPSHSSTIPVYGGPPMFPVMSAPMSSDPSKSSPELYQLGRAQSNASDGFDHSPPFPDFHPNGSFDQALPETRLGRQPASFAEHSFSHSNGNTSRLEMQGGVYNARPKTPVDMAGENGNGFFRSSQRTSMKNNGIPPNPHVFVRSVPVLRGRPPSMYAERVSDGKVSPGPRTTRSDERPRTRTRDNRDSSFHRSPPRSTNPANPRGSSMNFLSATINSSKSARSDGIFTRTHSREKNGKHSPLRPGNTYPSRSRPQQQTKPGARKTKPYKPWSYNRPSTSTSTTLRGHPPGISQTPNNELFTLSSFGPPPRSRTPVLTDAFPVPESSATSQYSDNSNQASVPTMMQDRFSSEGYHPLPRVGQFQPILQTSHSPQVLQQLAQRFSSPALFQLLLQVNAMNQEKFNPGAPSNTNSNGSAGFLSYRRTSRSKPNGSMSRSPKMVNGATQTSDGSRRSRPGSPLNGRPRQSRRPRTADSISSRGGAK